MFNPDKNSRLQIFLLKLPSGTGPDSLLNMSFKGLELFSRGSPTVCCVMNLLICPAVSHRRRSSSFVRTSRHKHRWWQYRPVPQALVSESCVSCMEPVSIWLPVSLPSQTPPPPGPPASQLSLWLAVVPRRSPYGRCCKVCFSGIFRLIVPSHTLPIDTFLSAPGDMIWSGDKLIPGGVVEFGVKEEAPDLDSESPLAVLIKVNCSMAQCCLIITY